MYKDISIIRAKAQIRKKDNTPIVICTVKEFTTRVTMTRKQWNNWTENLPVEDGAGICGSVLFYEVGESIYPHNGETCNTANSLVADFALVTGAKGMQQIALTNASKSIMERFGAAPIKIDEKIFNPEDYLKILSGKPSDEWESLLLDEDLTKNQASSVMKIAEERVANSIPF